MTKRTIIDFFKKKNGSPAASDTPPTSDIDIPPTADSALNTAASTPSEQPQASSSRDVGPTFDFNENEIQLSIEVSMLVLLLILTKTKFN
jgi:hypothetical protein